LQRQLQLIGCNLLGSCITERNLKCPENWEHTQLKNYSKSLGGIQNAFVPGEHCELFRQYLQRTIGKTFFLDTGWQHDS
jgi:hypothetical protein